MVRGTAAAERLSGHIRCRRSGCICMPGRREQRSWQLPKIDIPVGCSLLLLLLLRALLLLSHVPQLVLLMLFIQRFVRTATSQLAWLASQPWPLGKGLARSSVVLLPLRQQHGRRRHIARGGDGAAGQQRGGGLKSECALHKRAHGPCSKEGGRRGAALSSAGQAHGTDGTGRGRSQGSSGAAAVHASLRACKPRLLHTAQQWAQHRQEHVQGMDTAWAHHGQEHEYKHGQGMGEAHLPGLLMRSSSRLATAARRDGTGAC